MGFWHTGKQEFDEPTGLDFNFQIAKDEFICEICGKKFKTEKACSDHKFVSHPINKPRLFLFEKEVYNNFIITENVNSESINIINANKIFIDGRLADKNSLLEIFKHNSVHNIVLTGNEEAIQTKYTIQTQIASDEDILGIEDAFKNTISSRVLNEAAIMNFINIASKFPTAKNYYDGLSEYLIGVLIKDYVHTQGFKFEKYISKFERAAIELSSYNRGLSRIIRGIICFHFNQFINSYKICNNLRIGLAARQYININFDKSEYTSDFDKLLTDYHTEQIINWSTIPEAEVEKSIDTIIAFSNNSKILVNDKTKLFMLLCKVFFYKKDRRYFSIYFNKIKNVASLKYFCEKFERRMEGLWQ